MSISEKEIGHRMRARRTELGLSAMQVATDLNFTPEHYRKMEAGIRKQTLDTIASFAEHYHVSTDYLIRGYSNDDELRFSLETINSMLTKIKTCISHM